MLIVQLFPKIKSHLSFYNACMNSGIDNADSTALGATLLRFDNVDCTAISNCLSPIFLSTMLACTMELILGVTCKPSSSKSK